MQFILSTMYATFVRLIFGDIRLTTHGEFSFAINQPQSLATQPSKHKTGRGSGKVHDLIKGIIYATLRSSIRLTCLGKRAKFQRTMIKQVSGGMEGKILFG
jgi:hypothetical protein